MRTYDTPGKPIFEGTWTGITASKGFDSNLLAVPRSATHWVRFTTGSTADIIVGETVSGGTNHFSAVVVAFVKETGAFGTTNTTGILMVKDPSGAFTAETLTGAKSTGTVAIIQDFIEIPVGIVHPKTALISVESFPINTTVTGITPTAAAGTNNGVTVAAGMSWEIRGIDSLQKFRAINTVNASGSIMKYVLYY
jgi:hypothetical protein